MRWLLMLFLIGIAVPAWSGTVTLNQATGIMRSWESNTPSIPWDPATEVQIQWPTMPDVRAERWDGAQGMRPATTAELAAYDAAKTQAQTTQQFDGQKMLKAVAIYYCQQLVPTKTLAQCRQDILTIYQGLP